MTTHFAFSQTKNNTQTHLFDSVTTPISVSYFGNMLFNPGLKIGADKHLMLRYKEKEKRKKTKSIYKLCYMQPSVSFFSDPKTLSAIMANVEFGRRRFNTKLWYNEWSASLGYQQRINSGTTYISDSQGNISTTKKGTSRGYFYPGISFGTGKIFNTENQPITGFFKTNVNLLTGYNAGIVPEISMEFGIRMSVLKSSKVQRCKIKKK